MEDLNARPGASRDVGELERDVPAADENDSRRQLVELEETVAGDRELVAGYLSCGWSFLSGSLALNEVFLLIASTSCSGVTLRGWYLAQAQFF